jgi:hypothetical protein
MACHMAKKHSLKLYVLFIQPPPVCLAMVNKFTKRSFLVREVMVVFSDLIFWINLRYKAEFTHLVRNNIAEHGGVRDTSKRQRIKETIFFLNYPYFQMI